MPRSCEALDLVGVPSLANNLNENLARSRPVVVVYDNNLLPGAEGELLIGKWDGYSRAHQGCADMRKPVVVSPGLGMPAFQVARNQLVELFLHVLGQRWFEFYG